MEVQSANQSFIISWTTAVDFILENHNFYKRDKPLVNRCYMLGKIEESVRNLCLLDLDNAEVDERFKFVRLIFLKVGS